VCGASRLRKDRNSDPKAVEYAQLLNEAHAVLCDKRKRQLYAELSLLKILSDKN